MDKTPAQNIATLHDAQADPLARVEAAAMLLHDYHNLDRRTFLTAYEAAARVPDEDLKLASRLLLHFALNMARRKTPAAPHKSHPWTSSAPAGPAAPRPPRPAAPAGPPAPKKPDGRGRTKNRKLREDLLRPEHDPDSPGFQPIPGRGGSRYRFVFNDLTRGGFGVSIHWADFWINKVGFTDPFEAHKYALRAVRAFLLSAKEKQ
jgi:hypothetical protein